MVACHGYPDDTNTDPLSPISSRRQKRHGHSAEASVSTEDIDDSSAEQNGKLLYILQIAPFLL